ncbi:MULTISPECIES: hypothetical protein [Streptomyces violaceusniger group]|nr:MULTISPECIES: hypothetical protein [Streptomyces violaceusniger group]
MTDTTPETDGMSARVYLRRQGATAGTYLGVPLVGTYDVGSSGQDITVVPGSTPQKATYEWTLAVPQYAAGTSVTWAVTRLGPVWGCDLGSRGVARTLAALPKRPSSSATRAFRRLAIARTTPRSLIQITTPDRP